MKKILSILLAVALLMSLALTAFATEGETPVVTVASTTAEVGEEVTVDVSITATTLAGYGLKVVYDKEALEITKITKGADAGEGFFSGSKKTGKVTYATTYNEDMEGVLFTVTFKVLAEGQHTVSLEIDSFGRDDQTTFEVTTVDGVISVGDVGGEETEGGEGSIAVTVTDTYGWFDLYSMTAEATATYTFYVPAGLGVWSVESYMNWGEPEIDYNIQPDGGSFTVDLTEGQLYEFYVGAAVKGDYVITYTYTTAGEGGEGGDEPVDPPVVLPDIYDLVIGNNSINAADIGFKYTATEAGTLILNLGNPIMGPVEGVVTVNGANEQTLAPLGQITLELVAGDEVLILFTATGYATMTAEWETEGGEGGEGGETPVDPTEPDGTEAHPYIIEELPYEGTQDSNDDLYYQWTATENGTLYVYTEGGCSMVGSSVAGWEYIEGASGKYIEVAAGDVIIINIWGTTEFRVEFVPAGAEHEHAYEITENVPATCTEDGHVTYTCECGDTYTETTPATGHNFVDGVCTECGEEDPNYVPECEHNFVDGVCTECGEEDPNYNPETGSMNIFAVALIAAMSATAVVVTAKKRDEE